MSTTLSYHGILLTVLETEAYKKESIYDPSGVDYLYTRHTIKVKAIYNPRKVAYRDDLPSFDPTPRPPGLDIVAPQLASNQAFLAPRTDRAVRHRLMTPRGPLIYTVGEEDVLRVATRNPEARENDAIYPDSKNGPFPIECDVEEIVGTKTFRVSYTIQVHLQECPKYGKHPILLSNRYSRTNEVDQDFFSTIVTRGQAIFDTLRLRELRTVPDAFREELFLPIPRNFKREKISVTAMPDGTGVTYEIVDREMGLNILAWDNVTRIEAVYSEGVTGAGYMSAAGNAVEGARNTGTAAAMAGTGAVGATVGVAVGAAGGLASGIPTRRQTIVVRVWGNRFARRRNLEGVGWLLIRGRFPQLTGNPLVAERPRPAPAVAEEPRSLWQRIPNAIRWGIRVAAPMTGFALDYTQNPTFRENANRLLSSFSWTVTEDLMGKFVEIKGERVASIVESSYSYLTSNSPPFICQWRDSIRDVTTTENTINPAPSRGARGSYAENMVAAAFAIPCEEPRLPGQPQRPGELPEVPPRRPSPQPERPGDDTPPPPGPTIPDIRQRAQIPLLMGIVEPPPPPPILGEFIR